MESTPRLWDTFTYSSAMGGWHDLNRDLRLHLLEEQKRLSQGRPIIINISIDETKAKKGWFYLSFSIFLLSEAMSRGCSSLSGDVTSLNIVTASSASSEVKCDLNALTHLYICVVEVEEAQRRSGLTAGKRKFRGMTQARIADIIQLCTAELCVWLWFQVCRCKCEQLWMWKIL